MASAVTNGQADGAAAEAGRTSIFKNVRFWLARRLLDRYDLANKIKNHGGIIVPLEKDADMLIADPARKDSPQGSYSYMFIVDSVDNGFIQIKDKYCIGPDPELQRPEKNPKGSFRTKFTAEDDAVLAKWVLEHPTRSLRGNDTWKQLEEMNNRHTFQSWRDRYLKRYCDFSPAQLKGLVAGAKETSRKFESHVPGRTTGSKEGPTLGRGVEKDGARQDETRAPSSADKTGLRPVQRRQRQETSQSTKASENGKAPHKRQRSEELGTVEPRGDESFVAEEDADPDAGIETERERFYADLWDFVSELELDVNLQCHIGGRSFELWDLYEATDLPNLPVAEIDWETVAANLGYDQAQRAKVAGKLQQCYESNLRKFCEDFVCFDQESQGEDKEIGSEQGEGDGLPEEAVPAAGAEQPLSIYDILPSPSPASKATTSTKRPSIASWHSPKRLRLDQNAEIPSTPGMDRSPPLRSHVAQGMASPSLRKSIAHRSSYPGRNDKANVEQLSAPLRRDTTARSMVSSTIDDPFMSSPVTQGRVPSRRQGSEEMAVCGSWADNEDCGVTFTSPSTVKAQPKPMRRVLPLSFQRPATSSTLPQNARPPQAYSQSKKDRGGRPRNNEEEHDVSWWTKHYESLGYSRETIRDAMFRTSMVPGDKMEVVLQSLKAGIGVPKNYEGIWTEKDDKYLKFVDSVLTKRKEDNYTQAELPNKKRAEEVLKRLEHKHSPDQVEHRRRFLKEAEPTIAGRRQS